MISIKVVTKFRRVTFSLKYCYTLSISYCAGAAVGDRLARESRHTQSPTLPAVLFKLVKDMLTNYADLTKIVILYNDITDYIVKTT